jgi:hypothetical protein
MLDSRRDCRYRGGAHRNIGVGLGKVTFHDMLGTSSGVPGFPLTLIHPSAWKWNSQKFVVKDNPLLNLVRESLKVVTRDTKFIADSSN